MRVGGERIPLWLDRKTEPDIGAIKTQARNTQLRVKFGITREQYEALRTAQHNRCAICETAEPRAEATGT